VLFRLPQGQPRDAAYFLVDGAQSGASTSATRRQWKGRLIVRLYLFARPVPRLMPAPDAAAFWRRPGSDHPWRSPR